MLKKYIFKILNRLHVGNTNTSQKDFGITAVCFHRISDEIYPAYPCMPIETFKELIIYFSQNFSIILPKDIGIPSPKPKLIITFDDGYKDFLYNAMPILVQYKAPAIMHVVVNSVITGEYFWTQKVAHLVNQKLKLNEELKIELEDFKTTYKITASNAENISLELYSVLMKFDSVKRNSILTDLLSSIDCSQLTEMLNVNDIKLCLQNNIVIGSHSYTHENLTLNLSENSIYKEINESKKVLDKILGEDVDCFAFPNGLKKENLFDKLKDAGYKNIFTTEDVLYTPQPNAKLNIIPRIILYGKSADENILRVHFFHARIKKLFPKTY